MNTNKHQSIRRCEPRQKRGAAISNQKRDCFVALTSRDSSQRRKILPKALVAISLLLVFFRGLEVKASVLYAGAANQNVYEGQTFVVDWFLDTESQNINTLDLHLRFSADQLDLVSAEAGNSVVSLWVQPPTLISPAEISLSGGIPGGLSGRQLPIFRSTFRAKTSGEANITLDSASTVLLNDGQGSKDVLNFSPLHFFVLPKTAMPLVVVSSTHLNQEKWYKINVVKLSFTPKAGEQYSYNFSSNLDIILLPEPQVVPPEIVYKDLPDGIYYFKVNSRPVADKTVAGNWQEAGVFRVQIDATAPENFQGVLSSDPTMFGGRPFLSFNTVDKTSGVAGYAIKVGTFGNFYNQVSPFVPHRPLVGETIVIRAIDRAGNVRQVAVAYPGLLSPQQFFLPAGILLSLLFLLLYRWMRIFLRNTKKGQA
jgi:hypothetical protein